MFLSQSARVSLILSVVFAVANTGSAALVHYYAMNETVNPSNGTGASTIDTGTGPINATPYSTTAGPGPVRGVASADAGLYGTAYTINTSDAAGVDIGSGGLITGVASATTVTQYTIAAWVKPSGTQALSAAIMGSFSTNRGVDLLLVNGVGVQDPSKLYVQLYNRGGSVANTASMKFSTPLPTSAIDNWTHLAVTMDTASTVQLYVNGALFDAGGTIAIQPRNGGDEAFGQALATPNGGESFYQGGIDEVRIYNEVLDATTIAALAGVPEPSSMALLGLGMLGLVSRRPRKPWR